MATCSRILLVSYEWVHPGRWSKPSPFTEHFLTTTRRVSHRSIPLKILKIVLIFDDICVPSGQKHLRACWLYVGFRTCSQLQMSLLFFSGCSFVASPFNFASQEQKFKPRRSHFCKEMDKYVLRSPTGSRPGRPARWSS